MKLYSVFFKFHLKQRLLKLTQAPINTTNSFGITSRPEEELIVPANPTFTDGVATKDIHIDPLSSLSIRIFLPETCLAGSDSAHSKVRVRVRVSSNGSDFNSESNANGAYKGYTPPLESKMHNDFRKLPVMVQFHGGGFVSGSNDSVANDVFCRRIAKLCDVIVVAVGYRLAPESKYPAAFEDGLKVLNWLGKQANFAGCRLPLGNVRWVNRKSDAHPQIVGSFGANMVEPWLGAHGDLSRCVLIGVSCGANIADYVARKAVEAGNLLYPVKVVAQVLMYPFFIGSIPTHSEINLAKSYLYDKAMCMLTWKLFLPEEVFNLDHPAANPLIPGRGPPLKYMPPTLTIVAEHDLMRDRAIAYSEELRKVNVDAPLLDYKDAVHEFATHELLLKTPQAQACAEDIAIWVKKYISLRGHEFSY